MIARCVGFHTPHLEKKFLHESVFEVRALIAVYDVGDATQLYPVVPDSIGCFYGCERFDWNGDTVLGEMVDHHEDTDTPVVGLCELLVVNHD